MAKSKQVTQDDIRAAIEPLNDVGSRLSDMHKRILAGHLGEIPEAIKIARTLTLSARDCTDFALLMFNAAKANDQESERKAIEEEIARLKAQTKGQ